MFVFSMRWKSILPSKLLNYSRKSNNNKIISFCLYNEYLNQEEKIVGNLKVRKRKFHRKENIQQASLKVEFVLIHPT